MNGGGVAGTFSEHALELAEKVLTSAALQSYMLGPEVSFETGWIAGNADRGISLIGKPLPS